MSAMSKISVPIAVAVALGAIIGAGIFVLSGTAIALAGSYSLLAFVLVGFVAISLAVQFGNLGMIVPNAKGAAYSYVYRAFGSEMGFITGILLYFSYATSIAIVATGFGSTLASMLGTQYAHLSIAFSIVLIAVLSAVNLRGIGGAAKTDTVMVIAKILILAAFVAFAVLFAVSTGSSGASNFTVPAGTSPVIAILEASIAIFFAYSGFQTISTFTSRVKGGAAAAARAILIAVVISMVLYVLVVFSLILLVPASKFVVNADPLSFALSYVHAPESLFMLVNLGALLATASATLAMILTSSRIMYQISADGLLPGIMGRFNKKTDVASNAVLISGGIGVIALFAGNIFTITAIANFGLIFSYIVACLAIVHFRRTGSAQGINLRYYPYLQIGTIIALLVFMYGLPHKAFVINVILIISLIIIYYTLREAEVKRIVRVRLFK